MSYMLGITARPRPAGQQGPTGSSVLGFKCAGDVRAVLDWACGSKSQRCMLSIAHSFTTLQKSVRADLVGAKA